MVKQRQRVRLPAAELRGEIEDGVRFSFLAGQSADDLRSQTREIFGEISSLEESFRLLIVGWGRALANLIQMDGKFRRIEWFALAQIRARGDDFIPRFECHLLFVRGLVCRLQKIPVPLASVVQQVGVCHDLEVTASMLHAADKVSRFFISDEPSFVAPVGLVFFSDCQIRLELVHVFNRQPMGRPFEFDDYQLFSDSATRKVRPFLPRALFILVLHLVTDELQEAPVRLKQPVSLVNQPHCPFEDTVN